MTTTDTLLADLADVLERASKLAAELSATLAGPPVDMLKPSYWPERDGTLGELEPGDRVMLDGRWREVTGDGWVTPGTACDATPITARIQKRHGNVPIPDDPLREFRLPGGRVGYATSYADEVEVGDWVQRCHGDPEWHLVKGVQRLDPPLLRITYDGLAHDWAPTDAIRIATAPVPDPEPYR